MVSKKIYIDISSIHGTGVFAAEHLKKGTVIFDWKDVTRPLSNDELASLTVDEKQFVSRAADGTYVLFLPPARFVNHSCDANTVAIDGQDITLRDIQIGEEITANYVLEEALGVNMKCNCGSAKCKKQVNT